MKVLLTGASGFIGKSVLSLLKSEGIETIIAGKQIPPGISENEFLEVDLLDPTDFDKLFRKSGCTHLLHLAWYAEHGKFWTSPLNFRWVEATVRLSESFCRAGGQKIVLAGTCAEYDWSYGYCIEDSTPLNPGTIYGVAKDATRRLVSKLCAEHKTSFAWGRIFLPYGPEENPHRLIPSLTRVFEGLEAPFGVNSKAFRDFLHVADVAKGFFYILNSKAQGNFNICSGMPTQIIDIVNSIAKSRDANPEIVLNLNSARTEEPILLIGNNEKLKSLGWTPEHSINRYLANSNLRL